MALVGHFGTGREEPEVGRKGRILLLIVAALGSLPLIGLLVHRVPAAFLGTHAHAGG